MENYLTFVFYASAVFSVIGLVLSFCGVRAEGLKDFGDVLKAKKTDRGLVTAVVLFALVLIGTLLVALACIPGVWILQYRALVNVIGIPSWLFWTGFGLMLLATAVNWFRAATGKKDGVNTKPHAISSPMLPLILAVINYVGLYGLIS